MSNIVYHENGLVNLLENHETLRYMNYMRDGVRKKLPSSVLEQNTQKVYIYKNRPINLFELPKVIIEHNDFGITMNKWIYKLSEGVFSRNIWRTVGECLVVYIDLEEPAKLEINQLEDFFYLKLLSNGFKSEEIIDELLYKKQFYFIFDRLSIDTRSAYYNLSLRYKDYRQMAFTDVDCTEIEPLLDEYKYCRML